jgi:starch-binding outer membrane protein SusE/F
MKSFIHTTALLIALLFTAFGCKDEELDHLKVTAVQTLYSPNDNKSVQLQVSETAAVVFEWEQAKAEDGGMVMYEVAFDKVGGDFSNPVYVLSSDNNGIAHQANILHKTLNKIAGLAGIKPSETGKLIWTVISSKGINEEKSAQSRTIEITRLSGYDDVPANVYLTGEATEAGSDVTKAIQMKGLTNGSFEIYSQLTAGKTYQFIEKTGQARTFYASGSQLMLTGSATAGKTAVYYIFLDFPNGAVTMKEVVKLELFFAPNNVFQFALPYAGNGVFKAQNQSIVFKQESWGRDERYKFRMTLNDGTSDIYQWWGSKNGDNSRPSVTEPVSYWYLFSVPNDQWSNCFKFGDAIDNSTSDVIVYFQPDKEYTHEVIKK